MHQAKQHNIAKFTEIRRFAALKPAETREIQCPEKERSEAKFRGIQSCQEKTQNSAVFASFGKIWCGTTGLRENPLEPVCRENPKKSGFIPAPSGKKEKEQKIGNCGKTQVVKTVGISRE